MEKTHLVMNARKKSEARVKLSLLVILLIMMYIYLCSILYASPALEEAEG